MFCTNCKSEVPDGSQFCVNCGKSLDVTVMPGRAANYTPNATPVQPAATPITPPVSPVQPTPQVNPQTPNYYNQQPVYPVPQAPKKSGKGLVIGLLIALLVVALGAGGFLFYWFTRPIYKINKALAAEDYETVIDLYPSLKNEDEQATVIDAIIASEDLDAILDLYPLLSEDDQVTVEEYLYSYAESLRDDFVNETAELDDIEPILTRISDEVLADDDDFSDMIDEIEDLYNSREDFKTAEDYFASGMYEEAIEYYECVIEEDDNYDTAQDRIDECYSYLIPDITGTWYTTLDLSETMDSELGADGLKCHVDMDFNFYNDMSGVICMNSDSVYDAYDELVDSIIVVLKDEFREACDYDTSIDYDELLQLYVEDEGYASPEEYIEYEIVSFSDFSDYILDNTLEYTYEVNMDTFTLYYTGGSSEDFEYELNGNTLTILSFDSQNDADSSLGFNPPIDLKKR